MFRGPGGPPPGRPAGVSGSGGLCLGNLGPSLERHGAAIKKAREQPLGESQATTGNPGDHHQESLSIHCQENSGDHQGVPKDPL